MQSHFSVLPDSIHSCMMQSRISAITRKYWRFGIFGFLKVSQPSTDVKGKPSVLNCWSVLLLRGRPFCPGSSQWRNLGSPSWAGDEKAINGVASSAVTKKKVVQDNSFRRKAHDHRLLGHWWSDSSRCDGQRWDNQFGCIHQNPPKTKTALPASAA